MKISVVIVAAGMGSRMKAGQTKQLIEIGGKPILWHTLKAFQAMPCINDIVVVVREEEMAYIKTCIIGPGQMSKVSAVVAGGVERSDSVACGIEAVKDSDIVMIHDGARPFIELDAVKRLLKAMEETDAAILAIPAKDTIKQVAQDGSVLSTYNRKELWQVQTPQCFRRELLLEAFRGKDDVEGVIYDDAMLVEAVTSSTVKVVMGSDINIKITTPFDLIVGEGIHKMIKGETNVKKKDSTSCSGLSES